MRCEKTRISHKLNLVPRPFITQGRILGIGAALSALLLSSCAVWTRHSPWHSPRHSPGHSPSFGELQAPYPHSRSIVRVQWRFPTIAGQRKALGSDLWPCTWSADDNLYCAWGDGGGFDGNDDHVGRASLGFARITGRPTLTDASAYAGKNVWGQVPYAEAQATFGGKVESIISLDGVLYADAGLWTAATASDPLHTSEQGPLPALLRSADLGRSWSIISTAPELSQGAFLNFGRDNASAIDAYVYLYYVRSADPQHVYLKRIRKDRLAAPDVSAIDLEYLVGIVRHRSMALWAPEESKAYPIFFDRRGARGPSVVYDAALKRFLLTVGHSASAQEDAALIGQIGLFEAPHPWGPWATVGYYDHWGDVRGKAGDEFFGPSIPAKWISPDGRSFWAVFSGPGVYDSFNLVEGTLSTRRHWWSIR